jgi:hypothetical protein
VIKMDNRLIIGFITGILILGCFLVFQPQTGVQAQGESQQVQVEASSPMTLINTGDSWIHSTVMFESQNGGGIDTGDGNPKTVYAEIYKKPDSTPMTIDLTQPLGMNKQFPAGTVLRMKMWVELLKPEATSTDTLSFTLSGPNNQPIKVNEKISNVNQLPASINKDSLVFTTNPEEGAKLLQKMQAYYMEFILTFNADGTVTQKLSSTPTSSGTSGNSGSLSITRIPTPELCQLSAGIG